MTNYLPCSPCRRVSLPLPLVLVCFLGSPGLASAHDGHVHETISTLTWANAEPPTSAGALLLGLATASVMILACIAAFPQRRFVMPSVGCIAAVVCISCVSGDPVQGNDTPAPAMAKSFEPFAKKLKLRWDDRRLYVETDGLPDHPMMKGIRSWQQQVPLPQPYRGANAWQIPLKPVLADKPISARRALYRGAIALAVNGVPIFNALNNRGEDAYLAGELDDWGGHCGLGDDYHYHIAPLHLEEKVGRGQPIAYALDGFPIYGLTEADGSPVGKLDEFNGKFGADGTYRYHATKTYPYINGGLRGVVTVRGDQVEPQPRDAPVRPALSPLRGATITDFKAVGDKGYRLVYDLRGRKNAVEYTILADNSVRFVFEDSDGGKRTETYKRPPRRD